MFAHFLSALTVLYILLMGNKTVWGPVVGFFTQFFWIYYALFVIHQPGLLWGCTAIAIVQLRNWVKWHKESNQNASE